MLPNHVTQYPVCVLMSNIHVTEETGECPTCKLNMTYSCKSITPPVHLVLQNEVNQCPTYI